MSDESLLASGISESMALAIKDFVSAASDTTTDIDDDAAVGAAAGAVAGAVAGAIAGAIAGGTVAAAAGQ